MKINEHQKKGCNKVVDSKKNPFKFKLYPPLKDAMEGVHLVNGENIIEYRVKVNAFLKPRHNCLHLHWFYREYTPLNTSKRRRKCCH
jgi:hypothetical protein